MPQLERSDRAEALARALYETANGVNGYRPLHEHTPWGALPTGGVADLHRKRAREILRKLEANHGA